MTTSIYTVVLIFYSVITKIIKINIDVINNANLHRAKRNKNDEFYTKLSDIENELQYYKHHFKGKKIYCNCDTKESAFYKYFSDNYDTLGLSGLSICSSDFRNQESIDFLKEADIVVTNPPFSLFREFVAQLVEYDKKFLILGNNNAIGYKEIFPLIKENKLWLGYSYNKTMEFKLHNDYDKWDRVDEQGNKYGKVPAITWFTNLDIAKRHEELFTGMTYERGKAKGLYEKYDNYDAINISKVKEIPTDYEGIMGVPITYLGSHNPDQYEIIGEANHGLDNEYDLFEPLVNGVCKYKRILIKKVVKNQKF